MIPDRVDLNADCNVLMKITGLSGPALATGLLICLLGNPVLAQQNGFAGKVLRTYGPNQKLVNGIQYYNRHYRVRNHPYFLNDAYQTGTVVVNGEHFPDVRIRYNLFSQHLELEYETFSEASNALVMVDEHVDGFSLGGYSFARLDLEGEPLFYQVIETGSFTCYIQRQLDLVMFDQGFQFDEIYSDLESRFLITLHGDTFEFRNRKGFADCFPEPERKVIRRYLRQNHFVFKHAPPDEITRRMHDIYALLNSDPES